MNILNKVINGLVGLSVIAGVGSAIALAIAFGGRAAYADTDSIVPDCNEQTHFEFMCEENTRSI